MSIQSDKTKLDIITNPIFIFIGWIVYFYSIMYSKIGSEAFSVALLFAFFAVPIITFIIGRIIIGKNYHDFRWQVTFRAILIQYVNAQNGAILQISSNKSVETGQEIKAADQFLTSIVGILAFILLVISIFRLIDNFFEEMREIKDKQISGDKSARITSDSIMKDSIFGGISSFINDILDDSEKQILSLQDAIEIMGSTAEELNSSSEEVNASAEEVASTSQAMSDGATSQTELISNINDDLNDMQKIVDDIVKKIQLNTQEVSQIALQTNILALNAGIEASRAGDYGRGFAVVAENVRKLSDQSKLASERIETVADEIRETLQTSFVNISNAMVNVVSVSEETAASAEEVAAAAEEMTASMQEIANLSVRLSETGESLSL